MNSATKHTSEPSTFWLDSKTWRHGHSSFWLPKVYINRMTRARELHCRVQHMYLSIILTMVINTTKEGLSLYSHRLIESNGITALWILRIVCNVRKFMYANIFDLTDLKNNFILWSTSWPSEMLNDPIHVDIASMWNLGISHLGKKSASP